MPGIFDDERRGSGPISPDPRGTGLISAKRIDNSVPDPERVALSLDRAPGTRCNRRLMPLV
jgi:hypothetical protein